MVHQVVKSDDDEVDNTTGESGIYLQRLNGEIQHGEIEGRSAHADDPEAKNLRNQWQQGITSSISSTGSTITRQGANRAFCPPAT
jgi:hypothetical protein